MAEDDPGFVVESAFGDRLREGENLRVASTVSQRQFSG
jgi:hypothetical protein